MTHKLSSRIFALAGIVAVGLALFCSCNAGRPADAGHTMIAILPLTGNLAVIGTPKREAMELALAQVSLSFPDVKLKVEFQDSLGTPKDGVAALSQAIALQKPDFAFVDLTPIVDAAIPVVDAKHLVTFVGSAEAGLTQRSAYVFRVFPGGDQEIRLISQELQTHRPKNIFILHSNELYGRSVDQLLQSRAKELNIEVAGSEEYALADRDFRTQLTKARASNPQFIILLGYGNEYGLILRQASELKIEPAKFVSNLGAVNAGVMQLDSQFTEGLTFAGPLFALRMDNLDSYPPQKNMVEAYKAKYNHTPDFRVAFVYDTIMLLAKSLHEGGSVDAAVERLKSVTDYQGVSGKITISADRDASVEMTLATYHSGHPTQVQTQ
jgi:branched-chain amino acid transport system substrate-binding protein